MSPPLLFAIVGLSIALGWVGSLIVHHGRFVHQRRRLLRLIREYRQQESWLAKVHQHTPREIGTATYPGYPQPLTARLTDAVAHPGWRPPIQAEVLAELLDGPAVFFPPEIFTPTEHVTPERSETIVSHRAVVARTWPWQRWWTWLLAWPLEPAESFADWWRVSNHTPAHQLRKAPGAFGQVALWSGPTDSHPVTDAAIEALIDGEMAGVT